MLQTFTKFAYAKAGIRGIGISVQKGTCESVTGSPFTKYFPHPGNEVLINPIVGDIIYDDDTLISPFDGSNLYHRLGIYTDFGGTLVFNNQYRISPLGVITQILSCQGVGGTSLSITSSIPSSGTGTITISGGEPGEVISLQATIQNLGASGNTVSVSFSEGLSTLDIPMHGLRNGSVTLDGSGNKTINYTISPTNSTGYRVTIQITDRDSSEPMPSNDDTFFTVDP